jgi:hypothetical protein
MDPERFDAAAPAPPAVDTEEQVDEQVGATPEDGLAKTEAKQGPTGPTGARGPTGSTGPTGARGPLATSVAVGSAFLASTLFATATVDAECTADSEIIAGGFDTSVRGALSAEVKVKSAVAVEASGVTPAHYRVTFTRTATATADTIVVFAFAVCSP